MKSGTRFGRTVAMLGLLAFAGGCSVAGMVEDILETDPVQDALRDVDRAIDAIESGVASFDDLVGELGILRDNLDDGVYKRQVSELIHDAGQVGELAGAHVIDFTRNRVKEDLENLKRAILGRPPLERRPVVTTPDRKEINFADGAAGALRVIGWNLDIASADRAAYHVEVLSHIGPARVVPDRFVTYTGQYAVTVDLSSSGFDLVHHDRALSFVGYDGEFAIAIVDSAPPVPVGVPVEARVETSGSHARAVRSDCEVHSDDWTRVDVSYDLRAGAGGRALEARVVWSVYEAQDNKTIRRDKTHIRSVKDWHEIWRLPPVYDRLTAIPLDRTGERTQWYPGEAHGFKAFRNVGALQNIQVRFDGGGSDCGRQALEADVRLEVQAMELER